jgi:hypothetical protein
MQKITCKECGHRWEYAGDSKLILCPRCRSYVKNPEFVITKPTDSVMYTTLAKKMEVEQKRANRKSLKSIEEEIDKEDAMILSNSVKFHV